MAHQNTQASISRPIFSKQISPSDFVPVPESFVPEPESERAFTPEVSTPLAQQPHGYLPTPGNTFTRSREPTLLTEPELFEDHPMPQAEQREVPHDASRHSERSSTRNRPNYRALAGYASLREEKEEESLHCFTTLKASQFISKDEVPKTYRAARYGHKWEDWKPAFEKQMKEFEVPATA